MYIKEIKINGFKSFADKINLELNRNFTGIVGPNGSGKSNIVDALKWVMGEQSVKTLRGSAGMTDVIFNGSATRDKSRSASVALVLDNTDKSLPLDYTEIEIKRVVYKTGENEYYINKEKVRLKDITDLFIDSFSSKESLSIIPQGKISEILSGRPEDRRVILEEAAEVLKYKRRKEESLRKLGKTNENIERVDMIVSELETQVKPLEEQAKKAKVYKENKSRLEQIEVGLLATDIASLNEEYNLTKKEKEDLSLRLVEESANDSKEKVELENIKVERTNLDIEVSNTQKSLIEETEKLNELNARKELLKERNKYDKQNDSVQNNISNLKEEELKITSEINTLSTKHNENLEEQNKIQNCIDELNKKFNLLNSKEEQLTNEINANTRKKYELNSKKEIIETNIENMTNVPYAVKNVLNNPSLTGIIDRIGNLIDVKEEYSLAISTALAGAVNFVVTNKDEDAKHAIDFLKRTGKGRVTFFPLNLIKEKNIDNETLKIVTTMPGYINLASNLVEYNTLYKNIILNQLGNIIVADKIENALIISKKINTRYRVVTLDGEIIHVGGSLTGGSNKANDNKLNEKTELDNIIKNIKLIEKENELKENELKEISINITNTKDEIYKNNIEIIGIKETNELNSKHLDELNTKLNNIKDEIKGLTTSGDEISKELDELLKMYYETETNKNTLESKMSNLEKRRASLIENIEEKETTLRKYESKNKEISDKINSLEIKETKLNMNLDNLLNRLNEEYNMTFEKARNNYELEMDIESARTIIGNLKHEIKNLGEVNLASIEEYERVNKRYTFLSNQREDLKKSEQNLLDIIRNMDDVMIDKFATTFKKVNAEFGKVFKDLFGGGDAHLELTDPTNILETGIEIVANPPGKRPGSITLLSGGEKTLTAISLLFAIMNLKNVPFVILDEVESALDEVNVEKFGKYINTYKGKTQLLVITHKKKTMEFVDLLYGITMQESGVSKLVSVKLEDIK